MPRSPHLVRTSVALAAFAWVGACASLPDVSFDGPDGSADAEAGADARADAEAGADARADAEAGADARADADADADAQDDADAAPAFGDCPDAMPIGINWCCNDTPCRGGKQKCKTVCTSCESTCGASVCCLDKQGVVQGCADAAATCPAP